MLITRLITADLHGGSASPNYYSMNLFRMKKMILCLLLLNLQAKTAYSQNKSYQLFTDSIFPLLEKDYPQSKKIFEAYENAYGYDPSLILNFLQSSLGNNDVEFFKTRMLKLIHDYGYTYTYSDTIQKAYQDVDYLKELIREKGLSDWMANATLDYHHEWIKKHPDAIELARFMDKLLVRDQFIRNYSYQLRSECLPLIAEDSAAYKAFSDKMGSIFNAANLQNVYLIVDRAKINGRRLPTNFDYIGLGDHLELIVFHNLKSRVNTKLTWSLLHEYYEKAYLDGKASTHFFEYYDIYLHEIEGIQYYGTLGEAVPVADKKEYQKRKMRLHL